MSLPRRQAILVLGMHRSGTSAVAGALVLAGGAPPLEAMPATDDNPRGYWESRKIAQFNNALLESAGSRWSDSANIGDGWFGAPEREDDAARAADLVCREFGGTGVIVCKDPRICRLLPVWKRAFELMEADCHPVMVIRNPVDVAASLCRRAADPRFRPAAMGSLAEGLLLWLRYHLDAERHSRGLRRVVLEYESMLGDWTSAFAPLFSEGILHRPSMESAGRIGEFLDPRLNRGGIPETEQPVAGWKTTAAVHAAVSIGNFRHLEKIRAALDQLMAEQSTDAAFLLAQLDRLEEVP